MKYNKNYMRYLIYTQIYSYTVPINYYNEVSIKFKMQQTQ